MGEAGWAGTSSAMSSPRSALLTESERYVIVSGSIVWSIPTSAIEEMGRWAEAQGSERGGGWRGRWGMGGRGDLCRRYSGR